MKLGLGAAVLVLLVDAFAGRALAQTVTGVRLGQASSAETRIVFDVDGVPTYQISGDASGKGSLTISFAAGGSISRRTAAPKPLGQIAKAVRNGDAFTFYMSESSKIVDIFAILPSKANPSHRLVIDLRRAPAGEFLTSIPQNRAADVLDPMTEIIAASLGGTSTDKQVSAGEAEAAQRVAPVARKIIVIDPGHGGSDSGAVGATGIHEAAVTLAAALELKKILEKTERYDVVLTRNGNYRLALEERAPIARDARANLFLSLHADSLADARVRGASVYTLSEEGSERSAREAEKSSDFRVFDLNIAEAEPEVGGILFDLAQRRTGTESGRFADLLIDRLAGVTPLLNNTHRKENLKVLLAPDVPAVLLELAYLSNPKDEANLMSDAWRKRTMAAVASAINAYFDHEEFQRHAANKTDAVR